MRKIERQRKGVREVRKREQKRGKEGGRENDKGREEGRENKIGKEKGRMGGRG